jgi:hypothetical protein
MEICSEGLNRMKLEDDHAPFRSVLMVGMNLWIPLTAVTEMLIFMKYWLKHD